MIRNALAEALLFAAVALPLAWIAMILIGTFAHINHTTQFAVSYVQSWTITYVVLLVVNLVSK